MQNDYVSCLRIVFCLPFGSFSMRIQEVSIAKYFFFIFQIIFILFFYYWQYKILGIFMLWDGFRAAPGPQVSGERKVGFGVRVGPQKGPPCGPHGHWATTWGPRVTLHALRIRGQGLAQLTMIRHLLRRLRRRGVKRLRSLVKLFRLFFGIYCIINFRWKCCEIGIVFDRIFMNVGWIRDRFWDRSLICSTFFCSISDINLDLRIFINIWIYGCRYF